MTDQPSEFSDTEVAERRDDALRRALSMPPQPHTAKPAKAPGPVKVRASRKYAIARKPVRSA
jgi:hypothetical protein